jgi:hypothetical protein
LIRCGLLAQLLSVTTCDSLTVDDLALIGVSWWQ